MSQVITQSEVMSVGSLVGDVYSPDTKAFVGRELSEAELSRMVRIAVCALRNWRHAVAMESRDAVNAEIAGQPAGHQPSRSIMTTIAHGYCPPTKTTLAVRSVVGENNYVAAVQQSIDNGKTWQRMESVKMGGAEYPAPLAIDWSRESQAVMDSLICRVNGDTLGQKRFLETIATENKIRSRNIARRDGTAEMGRQYRAAWLARGMRSVKDVERGELRASQPDFRWLATMTDSQKKKMAERNAASVERWKAKGESTVEIPGIGAVPDIDIWRPAFEAYCGFCARHWAAKEGLGADIIRGTKTRSRPKQRKTAVNGKRVKQSVRAVTREQSEYLAEIHAEMIALQLLARIGSRPFGFGPAQRIARALSHQRGIDRANRHHLAVLNLRNAVLANGLPSEYADSARQSTLANVAKAIGGASSAPKDGKPRQNQWLVGQGIHSVGSDAGKRASAPKSEYVATDPRLADRLRALQETSRNEDIAGATLAAMELISDSRLTEKQRQFLAEYLAADCSATEWARKKNQSVGSVEQYLDAIRKRVAGADADEKQLDTVRQIARDAGEGTTIRAKISRKPNLDGPIRGFASIGIPALSLR